MKKSIITCVFALFSIYVFSQTVEVKNGKAVETIPKKEVELAKEQMLSKKQELADRVAIIQMQIVTLQKELTEAQSRLSNYQAVCTQLGYE